MFVLFFRVRIVCLGYLKRNQAKKSSLTHECGFFVSNIRFNSWGKICKTSKGSQTFWFAENFEFFPKILKQVGARIWRMKIRENESRMKEPSLSLFFLYSLNGGWDKLRNNPSFFYCSSRSMTRAIIFKCRVALIKWTRDARDNNKGKMIRDDKWTIKSVPIQFSI